MAMSPRRLPGALQAVGAPARRVLSPQAVPAEYRGRRVVILGLARQGVALARYLAEQGAAVVVSDRQPAPALAREMASLAGLPIEFVLGGHPDSLLDGADLLCLSGGVAADLP